MKFHPDRNPGQQGSRGEVQGGQEAYEMLSDPQKKAAYDRYGHAGVDPSMGAGPGAQGFDGFADAFGDIFGDLFGGGGGRGGARTSSRRRPALQTSRSPGRAARRREDDPHPHQEECGTCHGSGAKARHPPQALPHLPGPRPGARAARLLLDPADLPEVPRRRQDHPRPCRDCGGAGHQKAEDARGEDPAGIDDGMRLRHAGHGEPGLNGGPPGDLYVEIHIRKHAVFERDHDDLHCEMPISITTAALGGEIEIPDAGRHGAAEDPRGDAEQRSSGCAARASRTCAAT